MPELRPPNHRVQSHRRTGFITAPLDIRTLSECLVRLEELLTVAAAEQAAG